MFLIVLLPPILYESAINMERKHFFKNFGSILTLAIFGTIIATVITSFLTYWISLLGFSDSFNLNTCFAFGSLISATDPVAVLSIFKDINADNTIYTLIFGESTLNDAVSMILYDTTYELRGDTHSSSYGALFLQASKQFGMIFIGSMAIGIIIGIISAYTLKDGRSTLNTEITILVCIPWVSYLIASMLKMSGILCIMFCGITMARYALPNVTSVGKKINKRLYHTLAYNFENLSFLFIGIGIVAFDLPWRLRNPINNVTRFTMWFSGFRGAMAYALALQSTTQFTEGDAGNIMLTITLCYAIINIFVNASILEKLIDKLKIRQSDGMEEQLDISSISYRRGRRRRRTLELVEDEGIHSQSMQMNNHSRDEDEPDLSSQLDIDSKHEQNNIVKKKLLESQEDFEEGIESTPRKSGRRPKRRTIKRADSQKSKKTNQEYYDVEMHTEDQSESMEKPQKITKSNSKQLENDIQFQQSIQDNDHESSRKVLNIQIDQERLHENSPNNENSQPSTGSQKGVMKLSDDNIEQKSTN